jgi:spermidine/putrescine-binding protein
VNAWFKPSRRRVASKALLIALLGLALPSAVAAQKSLNVYSIWSENWARPMLQEFEAASGIKVKAAGRYSIDIPTPRLWQL